jgi:hypothetical protein
MSNNFPVQPVPVDRTIKQLHDQVQACKQWISASERHSVTIVFFAKVNGFDTTNLVKFEETLNDLSPGTLKHLHDFFQAVADEQLSKKILLQAQERNEELLNVHSSFKKHR